jgi:hypothetical protein
MVELFFEEIKGSLEQGKQVKISACSNDAYTLVEASMAQTFVS